MNIFLMLASILINYSAGIFRSTGTACACSI